MKIPDGPREGMAVPIDGVTLGRMEVGTWRTSAGDIDVLLGIPRDGRWDLARYEHLRENAVLIEIGDATVPAASLKDIMRSKEIANRTPDHEALPELRELDDELGNDYER